MYAYIGAYMYIDVCIYKQYTHIVLFVCVYGCECADKRIHTHMEMCTNWFLGLRHPY